MRRCTKEDYENKNVIIIAYGRKDYVFSIKEVKLAIDQAQLTDLKEESERGNLEIKEKITKLGDWYIDNSLIEHFNERYNSFDIAFSQEREISAKNIKDIYCVFSLPRVELGHLDAEGIEVDDKFD